MKIPRTGCYCCYCKRELTPALPEKSTSMTYDHVMAESRGGVRKVPCCRACNQLKDDLHMDDWFWFIRNHKRWWKTFMIPSQVKAVVREHRWNLAHAEKARREAAQAERRNAA